MSKKKTYRFTVEVFEGSPLRKWAEGLFQLELEETRARGILRLDRFENPFVLKGTASYEVMGGAFVMMSGSNSKADIQPSFIKMEDNHVPLVYVGGMLNILQYDINEWIPYLLQGHEKLADEASDP